MKGGKYAKTLESAYSSLEEVTFSNTMTVQIGKMLQNKPLF